MRISYDYQVFSWQEYGGISRYIYEVSSRIARLDVHAVSIIAPFYVNRYVAHAPAELRVMGLQIPKVPKTGRMFNVLNRMTAVPLMTYFKPDIVHETYYSAKRSAPKNAKVILTVYDMIHERFTRCFSTTDTTSRSKALSVQRADHVICISEQTRRDVIELLRVDPAKLSVVPLGFSLIDENPEPADCVPRRPFLLYVGNRDSYKNFEAFLRVFAASISIRSDYDLVCFGGGPLTIRENDLIASLGIAPHQVQQLSGSDAILASLYRTAQALVFPSLYEGFGIPPLEAMSFDCPVVCSGVSSIPEVVGDAAVLFDPKDRDSMKMAIERVLEDKELRVSLVARGRERIKLFSWERCSTETLSIYQRVLS